MLVFFKYDHLSAEYFINFPLVYFTDLTLGVSIERKAVMDCDYLRSANLSDLRVFSHNNSIQI